jgi:hypothetical protein
MPVPNYFSRKPAPVSLFEVTGGLNSSQISAEIARGARFVILQYIIAALLITVRRNSKVQFIRPGESAALKSLPYTALTLLLGWWGFWGLLFTPSTLYKNLSGGTDVTELVRAKLETSSSPAACASST